jgi:hypothetical protein
VDPTAIARLRAARLAPERWEAVGALLDRADAGDRDADRELDHVAFEASVRTKLGPSSGRAPAVVPSKQTSVLPVVGLVCGVPIVLIGFALGGGIVAVATLAFALFIFGVAMAGSRVTNRPRPVVVDDAVPMPEAIARRLSSG